jgi:small subunit ribosomal protein S17
MPEGTESPVTAPAKPHRKERVGNVVSAKMQKTIVVRVDRKFRHPIYKKVVTTSSKFYAHDEKNEARPGDTVRIEETRPLSKTKRWRLVEVIAREQGAEVAAA